MGESEPGARRVPSEKVVDTPTPLETAVTAGASRSKITGAALEQVLSALVVKIAGGDHEALGALYDRLSPLVFSVALRILRDRSDAEEVTLDVFSQLWRTAKQFRSERGGVLTWIAVLARSRALDRLRSRSARVRVQESVEQATHDVVSPSPNPEEFAALAEHRRAVRSALDLLSGEQREALEMAYFSGMSHSELAAALGQPLGTVKTRIRLGMIKLRQVLEEYAPQQGASSGVS